MSQFDTRTTTQALTLDLCFACQIAWFDTGELEMLPHVSIEPSLEARRTRAKAKIALESALRKDEKEFEAVVGFLHNVLWGLAD